MMDVAMVDPQNFKSCFRKDDSEGLLRHQYSSIVLGVLVLLVVQ
jgi:hypothetical protein